MKIEQIYTGCLAQGAYYITSNGEAAIIDPLREVQPYLERLEKDGVTLKYIFETHFHADFVSGHLDLSKKTGAPIIYGPTANPSFEATIAEDQQIFELGNVKIKVLHTPGHTMESACFLLLDENGKETALFSGDTLFLGDVGRPDLAQKAANLTQEELAGLLYESLYNKILPLPDEVTVYPAHGAGSACGKNMMKETVDSLGNQKKINYALNQPNKEAFIKAVLDGLTAPPQYFGMNVAMNKGGYTSFDEVLKNGKEALSVEDFETMAENTGALILDTRNAADFHQGFVPNSINIGLKGSFAPWVGAMIVDVKQPLLLVCEEGSVEETITRLARVGFDNIVGYLKGGFDSWKNSGKEIDTVKRISAETFANEYHKDTKVIDVRNLGEYSAEHIEDALSRPLMEINDWAKELDDTHFYLHCAGGYRSMIASSILNSRGIRNFTEVDGGFAKIKETSVPTTDFVCQSKIKF
ncbi:MBL fold metallo-hydrolase [Riemerella anatipestifer]|nr:MBL fold metallo-hydrolase [Riemerella anatipestifer]